MGQSCHGTKHNVDLLVDLQSSYVDHALAADSAWINADGCGRDSGTTDDDIFAGESPGDEIPTSAI